MKETYLLFLMKLNNNNIFVSKKFLIKNEAEKILIFWLRKSRQKISILFYLARIFETQPCETLSCLAISHGLTPRCAMSTIFWRTGSGRGRPFTYIPPNWLTPPCPKTEDLNHDNSGSNRITPIFFLELKNLETFFDSESFWKN